MIYGASARVDPYSLIPKYYQLREIIRQKIEDGEWAPHSAIPSERDLEDRYFLSRTTIREALKLLEQDGYIYRSHGRGTYVAPPKQLTSLNVTMSFTEEMRLRGMEAGQRILYAGMEVASARMREELSLGERSTRLFVVKRLRLADGEPLAIQTSHVLLPDDATVSADDLEKAGSLYDLLSLRFGLYMAQAEQTIEATVATPDEAALLGIAPGNPLLLLERRTYSQHRTPVEHSKMLHRGDRYRYSVRLTR